MRKPTPILLWMLLFIVIIAAICSALYEPLSRAFLANQVFNGMILGVFLLGVITNLRQVLTLFPDINWLNAFRSDDEAAQESRKPRLLASIATMLTGRSGDQFSLSAQAMRSLLDGIQTRLDESRDLSRYLIGLLVFLGLLGTFWGLLSTLSSVGTVIDGIAVEADDDISTAFNSLKSGLKEPLQGMGIAFSSSLFGLAGSLILGFLDLQAGHAQNRFFNELEDWLSGLTSLGGASYGSEGEQSSPVYIQALLEQTAENLNNLQRSMAQDLATRDNHHHQMQVLNDKIENLTNQMRSSQEMYMTMMRAKTENEVLSTEAFEHIRNLDHNFEGLIEAINQQRGHTVDEMRRELRLLARVLSKATQPGGDSSTLG